MITILSDGRIIGDGIFFDEGYDYQVGAWALDMYGDPTQHPSVLRMYPNGPGVSPSEVEDAFGPPRLKKTVGETQHVVYGNVDLMYGNDSQFLGAVFHFNRSENGIGGGSTKDVPSPSTRPEELGKDTTKKPEEIDHSLTYFVVRGSVEKYIGKRVAWAGKQATVRFEGETKSAIYIYIAQDSDGNCLADNPFTFSLPRQDDLPYTAAGRKRSRTPGGPVFLVIGTIAGEKEVLGMTPKGNRKFKAPILVDIIIDAPPESKPAGDDKPLEPGGRAKEEPGGVALSRIWTSSSGEHTVEAEMVDFKDGKVRLKKTDGKVITLPMEKLSKADQELVRSIAVTTPRSDKSKIAPWQTDVRAFRKAVAGMLAKVQPPSDTSDSLRAEGKAKELFAQFKDREVTWTITFEGLGKSNNVEFAESSPGKGAGSFIGPLEKFIIFSMTADPASVEGWKSIDKGSTVKCRASVDFLMLSTRWGGGGSFAGWMPIIALEKARPEK